MTSAVHTRQRSCSIVSPSWQNCVSCWRNHIFAVVLTYSSDKNWCPQNVPSAVARVWDVSRVVHDSKTKAVNLSSRPCPRVRPCIICFMPWRTLRIRAFNFHSPINADWRNVFCSLKVNHFTLFIRHRHRLLTLRHFHRCNSATSSGWTIKRHTSAGVLTDTSRLYVGSYLYFIHYICSLFNNAFSVRLCSIEWRDGKWMMNWKGFEGSGRGLI
jgi:hypothetical protein